MVVDAKNNLWVCHYNGAQISIYNLKGIRTHSISLPAKNITNCVFGGFQNNELFISTALQGMNTNEVKNYPFSGCLIKIKTNSRGKSVNVFKTKNLAI